MKYRTNSKENQTKAYFYEEKESETASQAREEGEPHIINTRTRPD